MGVLALVAASWAVAVHAAASQPSRGGAKLASPPNIILFVVDDLGFADLSLVRAMNACTVRSSTASVGARVHVRVL